MTRSSTYEVMSAGSLEGNDGGAATVCAQRISSSAALVIAFCNFIHSVTRPVIENCHT